MNGISRDTFRDMEDTNDKLNILFDYARESHRCACETKEEIETLKGKFESRKRFDTSLSAVAGVVGGFVAVITAKLWGR